MNLYDLGYYIVVFALLLYALLSFTIDFGNSIEEDWYSKDPDEYSSAQYDRLAAYSRISFSWNHHPTVGQTMQIKIRLFKNSNKGTLPHNLTKSDQISVKVVSQNDNCEVKCNQEARKFNGNLRCCKSRGNEVIHSFVPQKAGLYDIYVYINGEKMHVCPISKFFLPEKDLGFETTSLHHGLIPLLCVAGRKPCKLIVNLKDRFGNALNGNNIDISKLITWQFQNGSNHNFNHIKGAIESLDSKPSSSNVVINLELSEPGIFHGELLYKNVLLPKCNFTIVCVTQEEDNHITDIINKAFICPMKYKATLLENEPSFDLNIGLLQKLPQNQKSRSNCKLNLKKTSVQILMTPSTIYVRDYCSNSCKSLPDFKFTFKINLNCQIHALFPNYNTDVITFEIANTESVEDLVQMEMCVSHLRIFVAIFSVLLLNNAAGKETFTKKHDSFFKQIQNRENNQSSRSVVKLDISRENGFLATLLYTKAFSSDEWKKLFIIKFREETLAYDKALKQWFQVLFQEMFQSSKVSEGNHVGLFVPMGETLLIHPNPRNHIRLSDLTAHQGYWKLIGQIIGKCIFEYCVGGYTGSFQTVNARFTRAFLSQILGVQPNYKHFEKDDPVFYRSHVCTILSNDVKDMGLYFEDTDEYNQLASLYPTKVEIIRNGSQIKVTNENKLHYLNSLARFRFSERMKTEIQWILLGISEMVPLDSFFVFTESELELLLCGPSYYTIEDMLGYNPKYGNISTTERKILDWYTNAVTSMSHDNRGRLLQFTTGSSLLPSGCFSELNPPFQVEFLTEDFGGFPTTNKNRINCICLKNHKNYEKFERSLISVINNGNREYFSV